MKVGLFEKPQKTTKPRKGNSSILTSKTMCVGGEEEGGGGGGEESVVSSIYVKCRAKLNKRGETFHFFFMSSQK